MPLRSRESRASSQLRPPSTPEAQGPGIPRALRWQEPFLLPILLLLTARLVFAYYVPNPSEDAYITFRYARSFATGHGLVYNPGDRVMGFTSPLWTMWVSLGLLLRVDPTLWSRSTALLCDLTTLVLVTSLLRRTFSRASVWCFGIFFALWPYFSAVTASGMEGSLVFAMIAVSAVLAVRRHAAAPIALTALAFSRPEGLAIAALFSLRAGRRQAILSGGLVAAGLTAILLYYRTLVPQSVLAKAHVYGTPGPWAGRVWWLWLLPRPFLRNPGVVEYGQLVAFAMVFTPAVVNGARLLWVQRRDAIALIVLGSLSIWAAYSLLGVAYFYWYLFVPLMGFSILAAIGAPAMLRGAMLYGSLALCVATSFVDGLPVYVLRSMLETEGFTSAATYLRAHARPGEKAFLEPIGIIGWYCPLVIVDEVGLVSPRVARRRLAGPGWYSDTVDSEQPDWLVIRNSVLSSGDVWAGVGSPFRSAEELRDMLTRYAIVDSVTNGRGDDALLVLRRR